MDRSRNLARRTLGFFVTCVRSGDRFVRFFFRWPRLLALGDQEKQKFNDLGSHLFLPLLSQNVLGQPGPHRRLRRLEFDDSPTIPV